MGATRVADMIGKLNQDGGPLDYGLDRSRLLVRVQRALAQGRPVSREQVEQFVADLGIARVDADAFLRTVTERDAEDNIVGGLGLSLNDHPHRLLVNETRLAAWCALDTLFLPAVLGQTAAIESPSPVSGQLVRLRVSPQGVEEVSPDGAVVSIVVVDPATADVSSVEATWSTFCCHIFFFASRREAAQWAAGREDIEILPVAEGHELIRQVAERFLRYAA